jgi:hypothetical protein
MITPHSIIRTMFALSLYLDACHCKYSPVQNACAATARMLVRGFGMYLTPHPTSLLKRGGYLLGISANKM